jgi:hypothetical protein
MRRTTRITAAAAAALMVLGLAACGDDSDDATTTTAAAADATTTTTAKADQAAEGDTAAFCDALTSFNTAVNAVDTDSLTTPEAVKAAGQQLIPMFQKVVDSAPDDVSAAADELNTTIKPLADGDATAFGSDETYQKYNDFVTASLPSCDEISTVEVTAKDYAFEAPDTVEAGDLAFHMKNISTDEQHVMVLLRKNDGVDLSFDELLKLPQDQAESKTTEMGAAFAPPGGDSSALVTLEPGKYAMVCFLPIGGKEGAPPHFTQGMVHEFTVE